MPISKKLTKTINAKKTVSTKKTKVIPKVKKAVSSKKIPAFKTEAEERVFWQKNDSSDYIDWSKARPARFVNLKPSTKAISIRLPETLLYNIKMLANREDIPYQSMMKVLLSEAVREHHRG